MFCKECGTQLPDDAKFCINCGTITNSSPSQVQNNTNRDALEEYKRLYELYLKKDNSELVDILNPENGYRPIAMKAASDILKYGRIDCEKNIEQQGDSFSLPLQNEKKGSTAKTITMPLWKLIVGIICGLVGVAVLMSAASDLKHAHDLKESSSIIHETTMGA